MSGTPGRINARILPLLKKLEYATRKKATIQIQFGGYRSFVKGKGMEFDGYRAYSTTDDSSTIDWKATVRTGDLLIKEYVEERNLVVYILIDVGSTMVFGSTEQIKCEYAAELAASIGYAVLETDDSLGFAMFNDKVVANAVPSRGAKQMYLMAKALLNADNYRGEFSFKAAANFVLERLPPHSIVIFISDFLNLDKGFEPTLANLANRHDFVSIMVLDPRDLEMPATGMQVAIKHPHTGEEMLIDTEAVRDKYNKTAKSNIEKIIETFRKKGASMLMLRTDKSFEYPVRNFFAVRAARK